MLLQHLKNLNRISQTNYDRTKFLRLDKNERNSPFSKKIIKDIKNLVSSETLQTYQSNTKKLVNYISKNEKISKDYINILPGSDAGIKYIFEVFSMKKKPSAATIFPTYGMIEIYAKIYNFNLIKIKEKEFIEKKIFNKNLSFIYIANPNQPTGNYINKKIIFNIIKKAKKKGIIVIIDEAYIDFCKFKSMSTFIKRFNNLVILKTFSKSYGLAGLRIGYLIANKNFNKILNCVRSTFDISHFSIKVAEYLLRNRRIKKLYIKKVKLSKNYLVNQCKKRNLKFKDTEANFFYIKIPNNKIRKIYKFMFKNKILIRTNFFENFKDLNNCIRITVGDVYLMKKFFKFFDKVYGGKNIL